MGIRRIQKGLLLDVGCGSGTLSTRLARHGFGIVGIDTNAKMVRKVCRLADIVRYPLLLEEYSFILDDSCLEVDFMNIQSDEHTDRIV